MTMYEVVSKYASDIGMPIAVLEREAGVSNGVIGRWANDKSDPKIGTVSKVAAVLGIETWRLVREAQK